MSKKKFNESDIDKAGAMLDKVKVKRKPPVKQFIEQYISKIDELQEAGASLRNIFLTVNDGANLGISYATFQRYVQTVRKETGSKLYTAKEKKENWNCEKCKDSVAKKYGEKIIFVCDSCKTAYDADKNGKISTTRFSG